jgi:hypothetical protein
MKTLVSESVPGALATGRYARLWRALLGDIDHFLEWHARGVRTDPVAIAPGTDSTLLQFAGSFIAKSCKEFFE